MPWYYPKLDKDIERALEELGIEKGTVLDIGSGPGTQAIQLAKRGFKVTGLDIAEMAVEKAEELAAKAGVKVTFVAGDILKVKLRERFNVIIDRGCFHVLEPADRIRYVEKVAALLKLRGILLLKTFSFRQPPGPGPYRFSPDELQGFFKKKLKIHYITETAFRGRLDKAPKALFCVFQALSQKNT